MTREYVKSPLNYTGGKFKLLNQIIPLFPKEIDTFIDAFGGGANLSVNVKADRIIYNDVEGRIAHIISAIKNVNIQEALAYFDSLINIYELSATNKDGYIALRTEYNNHPNPLLLYMLICHSFSNQFRFNKRGNFNVPFGKRTFNEQLRKEYIQFAELLNRKNLVIYSTSFEILLDRVDMDRNTLVYCDPPYLNSSASYNEKGGWTKEKEQLLLQKLDKLDEQGIRFALSNNLQYENPLLSEWMQNKNNVHYLDCSYGNCSYHKKDRSGGQEILVTNY